MNQLVSKLKNWGGWFAILVPMAMVIGSACAFFLWSLDALTRVRFSYPRLVFLLPLAGVCIAFIYQKYGKSVSGGNLLLIQEVNHPRAGVPRRMAPLILLSALITHLFGGSAGRGGTALQIGGSIAASFSRFFKLHPDQVRILLMAGVAAGFSSVFSTPVTGAIFALEVLVIGRIPYGAVLPCLIASILADLTCGAWGAHREEYQIADLANSIFPSFWLIGKVVLAAIVFGLASRLFVSFYQALSHLFVKHISHAMLRPFIGGSMVIGLFFIVGNGDYLGLGILPGRPGAVTLPALFTSSEIPATAWLWKLVFTVVTLSSGFKGGEIAPLFFIGAALGNFLAVSLGAPIDLFAGLGLVAIFSGASKAPITSTFLGMELFGISHGICIAVACIIAYQCSGKKGIYSLQSVDLAGAHK
ncbi:MAG: voltage-gated chloride channel protein [Akkermansiaceae bacterium]|nr:voltage-gated chloride channel protein [Akkermansiaceae bacterium]